jgi:SAM-dependent methyltransferase
MSFRTDADPLRTFDLRASLYERGRPDYPVAAVNALLAGLGDSDGIRIADMGAGTARLARLFVARGCRVVAVEPNAEMRAAAPALAGLEWVAASAEEAGLPDDSLDLITVAQAFHWLEPQRALPEFRRMLVPGGRLAVIWNDRRVESDFEREYQAVLRELKPPARRDSSPKDSTEALRGTAWFEDPELSVFAHEHAMSAEVLLARTLSLSYAPVEAAARASLGRRLRRLHAERADAQGLVVQGYEARVHLTHARS